MHHQIDASIPSQSSLHIRDQPGKKRFIRIISCLSKTKVILLSHLSAIGQISQQLLSYLQEDNPTSQPAPEEELSATCLLEEAPIIG